MKEPCTNAEKKAEKFGKFADFIKICRFKNRKHLLTMTIIKVKNMLCSRCITAVRRILQSHQLKVVEIDLGEAVVAEDISPEAKSRIAAELAEEGFELLDDPRTAMVERIKGAVIEWVRNLSNRPKLSVWLASQLARDYSALSHLFSEVCGITIERYCINQRIEYVKELMFYSEHSLSEIAWDLGYSSPAHLSSQFKQVTGLSPREFRDLHSSDKAATRRSIDEL